MHWFIRIRDDRGRKVGLARVYGLAAVLPWVRDLPPEVHKAVMHHAKADMSSSPRVVGVAFGAMMIPPVMMGFALMAYAFFGPARGPHWMITSLPQFLMPIWLMLGPISVAHALRDVTRRRVLDEHHCACCGYNLNDQPMRPDGLTICPECSAAWALPLAT